MNIGVPKEIKDNENRVSVIPAGVRQLVCAGSEVYVEKGAGEGIGITDSDYLSAGAHLVSTAEEVFERAEMIIKVKEPLESELKLLRPKHLLYTFLHLAADKALAEKLMQSGCTSVAYETIQLENGRLPLLEPMSEVAGRMATQIGADYLQSSNGGKGVLLGGVPGVRRGRVTVIGCGVAGTNAIKMAVGLGAEVTAIDLNLSRLAYMDDLFGSRVTTLFSNADNIEEAVCQSDLVIGAVLIPGAKSPKLVTKKMISHMEKGSVLVDIAVDQGGCIETCRPTTHHDPTFEIDGVTHYCVANIPGAVAKTSTYALTNVTLKYAVDIARRGLRRAMETDSALRLGVNTWQGDLVYPQIAHDLGLPLRELDF